jgi:hypothetical protein
MAKPKLALIPAAQGTSLYSVLPSSGVGDFDFTRSGSATRINSQGLIETVGSGVSRLNYPMIDGVVKGCPHHILEPQSLNQIINSENLSNSSWGKTNAVVESNSTISPNGTLTADKLTFNTSGNFGRIVSSNLTFINSVSFFIKYIDLEYILIFLGTSSNGVYVNIKEGYATSTVIGAGLDITFKKYPNDWLRIEASGGNNGTSLEIYAANSIPNYNPITLNGSFYLWGIQAETNSYPTSYIPTNGSTVTRNAETCTGAGDAATFNDSEGVLMVEISALSDDTTSKTISLTNGSQSNGIELFYFGGNSIYINLWSGGVSQGFLNYEIDIQNFNKVSYSYKLNDTALWINGFKVDTDTSASMPIGLSELAFENGVNANYWYGKAKQVQYYNSALTDSELEQLTSWTSFSDMANGQQYTII